MARPMPVLPLVGSTRVSPGLMVPRRSASSTMASAMRSLTEPPGLSDSILATTSAAPSGTTWLSRTIGVPPITSRTLFAMPCCLLISDDVTAAGLTDTTVARGQVRDRYALQHPDHGLLHVLPHAALGAAAGTRASAALAEAIDRHDRAFQRLNDLADANVIGLADEDMAALRAADAADEAGAPQGSQELLQVRLRDILPRGDLAALSRARLVAMVHQLNECANAVVAFGGDSQISFLK